tara:strand:- start:1640 stop:3118 length:1479 start_codon:yes stop_codon:yes gene_type:complete
MEYNSFKNITLIIPELFLGASIISLILFGSSIVSNQNKNYPLITASISKLAVLILLFDIVFIYNNSFTYDNFSFTNSITQDNLSTQIQLVLLSTSIVGILITENYSKHQKMTSFEYTIIFLLSLEGLLLLCSSCDLISVYLAIELQSLAFYVLAGYKKNSTFSTESGIKYFILGSLSSGFLLFGFSLVYGYTGLTNFEDISKFVLNTSYDKNGLLDVALMFILIGLFFKMSAAPFHLWSPDIYEGSPSNSTIFFALLPKLSILVIFVRIFYSTFYDYACSYVEVISVIAICSVFVGSLGALMQRKIKSLVAYSSISHVGFMLIAFSALTDDGIQALFFYLIIYVLTSICIWTVFMSLNLKQYVFKKTSKHLSDLTYISVLNPILAVTFCTAFLSLAGIPPLIGFYSKTIVFLCAMDSSLYFLALASILISVISTFYYLRVIKSVYFEKTTNLKLYCNIDYSKAGIIMFTFLAFIYLFINPNLMSLVCYKIIR